MYVCDIILQSGENEHDLPRIVLWSGVNGIRYEAFCIVRECVICFSMKCAVAAVDTNGMTKNTERTVLVQWKKM